MRFLFPQNLDRRIIFALVALALALPIVFKLSIPPARMKSAEKLFKVIDELQVREGQIVFLAMDFGPNIKAENQPQAEVVIEHLMRRRIPLAVFSLYQLADPFLASVPDLIAQRLMKENPGETWDYGRDWVNLGYSPGGFQIVKAISKSEDVAGLFDKDARGNSLAELPAFRGVKRLEDIPLLVQFTGLVGMLDVYIQFFQKSGYRPRFGHGCTSITIPEAYIYLDSGQLNGLLEGLAGAAWYSELLRRRFENGGSQEAVLTNTGLGVAHLVVIVLIVFGNLAACFNRRRSKP